MSAVAPSTTPTGVVEVRQLRAGEEAPVRAVFDGMSGRSRRLRFHAPVPRLTGAMLRGLTDVVPGRHVALVASVRGRDVAVARWIRDRRDTKVAEVALSVVDVLQGRGLGRRLLGELARSARAAGVLELQFFVHPENDVMLHLLARVGARVVTEDDYGVELRADADAMKSVTTDSMSSRSAASGRW